MTFNAALYLSSIDTPEPSEFVPDVLPPSMRDVDASPPMQMNQPMQDPCPACGGWCMQLGDYVCWGVCVHCAVPERGDL